MTADTPFHDIRALVASMPGPDPEARTIVKSALADFIGPVAPIGRTETAVYWLADWQRSTRPGIRKPLIAVFAGSHKIAEFVHDEEVLFRAKTRVKELSEGSAGVRGVAASLQAAFKVFEMGLEYPAEDFRNKTSLSEKECAAAIAFGMEVVAEGADIIVLGNAGFGAATAAAAITLGLYGGSAEYWSGGTLPDSKNKTTLQRVEAIQMGTGFHKDVLGDPLQILQAFGGRDIAGMVGAILAARHQSIPIILDGFVSCAAAAILHSINPQAIDHCMAGHLTAEPGHEALLDRLDLSPLLNLSIGVGDGTGGALALGVLRGATGALETLAGG